MVSCPDGTSNSALKRSPSRRWTRLSLILFMSAATQAAEAMEMNQLSPEVNARRHTYGWRGNISTSVFCHTCLKQRPFRCKPTVKLMLWKQDRARTRTAGDGPGIRRTGWKTSTRLQPGRAALWLQCPSEPWQS